MEKTEIASLLGKLESHIRSERFGTEPSSLYEPLRYIMLLGGKRIRPMLTLLAYSIYKNDAERIIPLATTVEVFHNFTLLHDDIMDNAPLRRGKKTVHEKWGANTAILSGDVMLVKVYERLLQLPPNKLAAVLQLFNECATGVCQGQQLDMEFETKKRVTSQEYLAMVRQKTALLLGFCMEFGALLADAPADDRTLLREFGINIGIGFQLKDDLLDVYGNKGEFGKQVGGDIIANKKTFLLITALQIARGRDKIEIEKWLSRKTFDKRRKVRAVTALYDKLGIHAIAERMISEYVEKGFKSLRAISSSSSTGTLIAYAQELALRNK